MSTAGGTKGGDALRAVGPLASWVPAGWYPDPIGVGAARYWDGEQWTERYRDAPGPQPIPAEPPSEVAAPQPSESPPAATPIPAESTPQASAAQSGPDGKAKPPSALDRWKEIPKAAQIAIGVVVVIIIAGIAGSGGSKKASTSATTPASIAPSTTATRTQTPVSLKLATGNYSMTGSHTTLRGTVTPGASVTVDEHPAQVSGSHWSKVVALQLGENTMAVSADMAGHESAHESLTVTRNESQGEREAKQRASEEAQHRHEAAEAEQKQHYMETAQEIPYAQLNKNPEEYVGKTVKYHGQILQIQETGGEGVMLLSVTEVTEGLWDDNVWVNYGFHVKAAAKDLVTVYGEVTGQKSYKTQIGGETYVPEIKAKYVIEG